jgi:hypothetical protein
VARRVPGNHFLSVLSILIGTILPTRWIENHRQLRACYARKASMPARCFRRFHSFTAFPRHSRPPNESRRLASKWYQVWNTGSSIHFPKTRIALLRSILRRYVSYQFPTLPSHSSPAVRIRSKSSLILDKLKKSDSWRMCLNHIRITPPCAAGRVDGRVSCRQESSDEMTVSPGERNPLGAWSANIGNGKRLCHTTCFSITMTTGFHR